jgi:multiple antibiotic resistance protein
MLIEMISFALIFQIFVLLTPLSSVPVMLDAYGQRMNVKKIVINAIILAYIIAIAIALVGPSLFNLFGITLDSFRIAGGIILLLLGIDKTRSKKKEKGGIKKIDAIVSIMATPLLTGPATMSFITIKTYELGLLSLFLNITGAFILLSIVFAIFLLMLPRINEKIVSILAKILGLFLIAVAIEMIAKGIHGLFPAVGLPI